MLDVSIRTELLRLMLDLRQERGLTYLFITHDLSLAWVIADRIAVMYLGRIMEIGPADAVIKTPHHPYTAALVSVSPTPVPPAAGGPRRTILVGETPDAAFVPSGCRFHPRCPLAFDRCKTEEPPMFDVGGGQSAACWLAEGGRSLPVMPGSPVRTTDPVAPVAASPAPDAVDAPARRARRRRPRHPRRTLPHDRRPVEPGHRGARTRDHRRPADRERRDRGRRADRARCAGRLAARARGVERERVRRASHRGRAARVRRPHPDDRGGRPGRQHPGHPARPRGLGSAGGRAAADGTTSATPRELADEFAALRADGVALVRGLDPADLARQGMHPEVGLLRVDELLGEWVHHDRNHIRQMLAVTQARVWGQMGNARRFSLEDL